MTTIHDECPYGASDCPKIESLRRTIERNGRDLEELKDNVAQLTTTIRNTSFFILIAATIIAGFIGVLVI